MNNPRVARKAILFSLTAAYVLAATLLMRATAAPVASPGHLGTALALRTLNTAKTFRQGVTDPRHAANGRYLFDKSRRLARPLAGSGTTLFQVSEAVQTFDIFAPTPAFVPARPRRRPARSRPKTCTPCGPPRRASSSSRPTGPAPSRATPPATSHIWAAPQDGSAAAVQITSGSGDDLYPALSSGDRSSPSFPPPTRRGCITCTLIR